jgi:hypothetical protein
MIDKKEFKKMAKKILKSDRGVQNPKLMHPAREWGIGVLSGLLVLAASAAWSANTYVSYRNNANINNSSVDSEVIIYRALQVETALKTFSDRNERYGSFVGGNNNLPGEEPVLEVEIDLSTSTEEVSDEPEAEFVTEEELAVQPEAEPASDEDTSVDEIPAVQEVDMNSLQLN